MAKNQNNNVAPATKKTGAEAKKDALATLSNYLSQPSRIASVSNSGFNAMQI